MTLATPLPAARRTGGLIALLVVLGTAWGLTQPLGKIAVSAGYPTFGLVFWQLALGILVLGGIAVLRGTVLPMNGPAIRFYVIVAVIGTLVPNSTFYTSVAHLPAGIMSINIATIPLLAFPIALAIGADRFSFVRLAGLLCGLAGVALIALPEAALPSPEMAAWLPVAIIGPLFYAIEANYVARSSAIRLDPVQAMLGASVAGAVLMFPLVTATGQWFVPLSPFGLPEAAIVASGVIHAVTYAAYVWLAGAAGAVFAAQVSYVVTASGVVWAMLILGERFSGWVWAAMVVMMAGLFLVQPRVGAGTSGARNDR
jgi:drug/metabolite transporter (DMT)-like permease